MATIKDVTDKAAAEIGVKEYPSCSNNVKYNTMFYGKPVAGSAYPWCCAFIWWLLSTSGISVPKTALCTTLGEYFKSQGRFYTSNPQVGDIVFFKFNTNNRWTNHVGIVVGVRGNEIETIEGNTSVNSNDNGGTVMRRKRSSNIVGFGRPAYTEGSANVKQLPVLKIGSRGEYVLAWQKFLNLNGYPCGAENSIFGQNVKRAVMDFQLSRGLEPDGIIGRQTWAAIGFK